MTAYAAWLLTSFTTDDGDGAAAAAYANDPFVVVTDERADAEGPTR